MFKEERKQYAEDCKTNERPWDLWEYKAIACDTWEPLTGEPIWHFNCIYRRKQTTFVPEYFSGLNWRDAEHLIGKTVECSNNPDYGWEVGLLRRIVPIGKNFYVSMNFYTYIRTCEETSKHQTINIGGVELPMPETVEPALGTQYWLSPACNEMVWGGSYHINALKSGRVHLTKDNAKAWADWWKTTVIDKMQ